MSEIYKYLTVTLSDYVRMEKQVEEANAELGCLRALNAELVRTGIRLGSWIETIHWDPRETNTQEWLDGLRLRSDAFEIAVIDAQAAGIVPGSVPPVKPDRD